MKGSESIEPKKQPKLINALELVSLLGYAGPASNIHVRIHSKKGPAREGIVKWHDDRTNGPAIVIPNPKNTYDERVIPLGGQTVYNTPPRISSMDRASNTPKMFGEVSAHIIPINSDTDNMQFEVIEEK